MPHLGPKPSSLRRIRLKLPVHKIANRDASSLPAMSLTPAQLCCPPAGKCSSTGDGVPPPEGGTPPAPLTRSLRNQNTASCALTSEGAGARGPATPSDSDSEHVVRVTAGESQRSWASELLGGQRGWSVSEKFSRISALTGEAVLTQVQTHSQLIEGTNRGKLGGIERLRTNLDLTFGL